MKTGEDFRKAFPDTEDSFRNAAYQALTALHPPRSKTSLRFKPLLAFALILALLMGAAVAGTVEKWSLFSNVPDYMRTATEAEQKQMKSSFQPVSVNGRYVNMTVREAVYDGFGLYMAVDMVPHNAEVFLIPDLNVELDEPADEAFGSFPSDVTLAEHIAALGYTAIYRVDISTRIQSMIFPGGIAYNEDGSFTFFVRQRVTDPAYLQQAELSAILGAVIMRNTGSQVTNGSTWLETVEAELNIPAQPLLEVKQSAEAFSHVFEKSGAKITNIKLQRTPLTTYLTADVIVINEEAFADRFPNYYFSPSDKDGTHLHSGYFNISGISINQETGSYEYRCTLSLSTLPEMLYMSEYERGSNAPVPLDTIRIPLQ